MHDMGKKEGKN